MACAAYSQVHATIPSRMEVKTQINIKMESRLHNGKVKEKGSDEWKVSLFERLERSNIERKYPFNPSLTNLTTGDIKVNDKRDGTYEAHILFKTPGEYSLDISCNGEEIGGMFPLDIIVEGEKVKGERKKNNEKQNYTSTTHIHSDVWPLTPSIFDFVFVGKKRRDDSSGEEEISPTSTPSRRELSKSHGRLWKRSKSMTFSTSAIKKKFERAKKKSYRNLSLTSSIANNVVRNQCKIHLQVPSSFFISHFSQLHRHRRMKRRRRGNRQDQNKLTLDQHKVKERMVEKEEDGCTISLLLNSSTLST